MSYAIPGIDYESVTAVEEAPPDLIFVPRSRHQWLAFIMPLMLCGLSWMQGGVGELTDIGFAIFTVACACFLISEFFRFPRRFGIGGLVLYGGTLTWFCQDYFTHWFGADYASSPIPAWVVAKAATLHVLFVMLMSIGVNITYGRIFEKALLIVPDPGQPRFYLYIVVGLFCFTLCPYFIFSAQPFYSAIYHALFAGWVGAPQLTVFRSGNLNYNWGGYVAQIMQVGEVGGIVAIIYAILIAPSWPTRLIGFSIWWFNAMIGFETGRRGEVAFALLPPIALLFIKYQAKAANAFRKFSLKPFIICGLLALGMQFVVQFQGTFRDMEGGYNSAEWSKFHLFKNQGNTMFSEGLLAYGQIGETLPYFYSQDFPGEGTLVALPHTAFDLVVGIIPRALWHNKPVDALWEWYNKAYTGIGNGQEGTTISHGLVGSWYFKYGFFGMMEGAIFVGWLLGISERALQHSEGKPIGILMSLGFATWLFRTYRDFIFIELYGLILGGIVLCIMIPILRPIFGGSSNQSAQ